MDFIDEPISVKISSTDCKPKSPISRDSDENRSLRQYCELHPHKIKIAHININSIRNKLDLLSDQVKGNGDILMISEIKIDESFPVCQFEIDGFNIPFRVDRDQKGGGIMLYFREDLPAKLLSIDRTNDSGFVQLNLKRTKWLISYSNNPNKSNIYSHLESLSRNLDLFSSKYENYLVVGNFNVSVEEANIKNFCERFSLKNLIKDLTCFKNPGNPSCIDLFFTNKAIRFQRSYVIETGLSDFHKMTLTVLKCNFVN